MHLEGFDEGLKLVEPGLQLLDESVPYLPTHLYSALQVVMSDDLQGSDEARVQVGKHLLFNVLQVDDELISLKLFYLGYLGGRHQSKHGSQNDSVCASF